MALPTALPTRAPSGFPGSPGSPAPPYPLPQLLGVSSFLPATSPGSSEAHYLVPLKTVLPCICSRPSHPSSGQLSVFEGLGSVLVGWLAFTIALPFGPLTGDCSSPHFTDRKSEAERSKVTCSRPKTQLGRGPSLSSLPRAEWLQTSVCHDSRDNSPGGPAQM